MNHDQRRAELADFLRTRRLALQPEAVGLASRASRRRTPGLRREDVADLASISVSWYSSLEQARDIRVSEHVLTSLAEALRLNAEERDYFFALASEGGDTRAGASAPSDGVPPTLQRILDSQQPHPAFVLGPRFDILAWNRATTDVYGDLTAVPPEHRHMLRLFFGGHLRELILNWEPSARSLLAEFRAATGMYVHEPWFTDLVGELSWNSAEFNGWWQQHEVERHRVTAREVKHPRVGRLVLEEIALVVDDCSGQRIVLGIPQPGTETESKLTALSWRPRRAHVPPRHAHRAPRPAERRNSH
ncbi:helix-turn-helix transcriptional regulator [Streptomyces sp. NBC_00316]|uniref:helix-turn-helix transcriptional regulator n=1 Tax=Streptomyces sp. NBC_00316 TaxID=2975710 RepID=UPI002E2C18F3|nr:helix-turn-helix transcriptional regulator [Streptomyces sp. NBC_00316]